MRTFFLMTALTTLFFSCQTYTENDLNEFEAKIKAWSTKKDIVFERTDSGLYYHYLKEGTGPKVKYTDSVSVLFKGKLLNGTLFEMEKEPITFAVKDMIGGWKEGLMLSEKGSQIQIIVPPQLGYGNHKLDKIPSNSILFYEIEIVGIK